jgi:FixJ family two-component response regulator
MLAVSILVLIVDDDEAVRNALQFSLQLEGLVVRTHPNAESLLSDPNLEQANCIVLDDRLPEMEGFALLHRLRGRQENVSFILLTGHATLDVRYQAMRHGAQLVLEKPFFDNGLAKSVWALLEPERSALRTIP